MSYVPPAGGDISVQPEDVWHVEETIVSDQAIALTIVAAAALFVFIATQIDLTP